MFIAMFAAFGFGLIGFMDDFIKVVKKRNLGLRPWQKVAGQVGVTAAFLLALHMNGTLVSMVTVPFFGLVDLGFFAAVAVLHYVLRYLCGHAGLFVPDKPS